MQSAALERSRAFLPSDGDQRAHEDAHHAGRQNEEEHAPDQVTERFTADCSRPRCKLLESRGIRWFSRLVRPAPFALLPEVGQNDTLSWTDAAQRDLFSFGTLLLLKVIRSGEPRGPGRRLESRTRITSRTHCAAAVLPVIVKDEAVRRE
jgi:hypothetical protein